MTSAGGRERPTATVIVSEFRDGSVPDIDEAYVFAVIRQLAGIFAGYYSGQSQKVKTILTAGK